eukprot:gnl/MRDRNA2_/MRDRNA2_97311_c0_seq1.p1 gnl/MRDRNA2_/MRDRNA2_97311_c0~~gnl/MRDRNA2_/MRDRNA2_97311_c0_seq1.p1  ORF type:complete len:331 (-),score=118.39 gnl/MRDRNA2_/MRDRNA2_97311_c0_seq1:19-1011(-)
MTVSQRLLEVASRIDSYVDLIPSRYYLNENQQDALKDADKKKKKRPSYDPALCKTTSQLLAQAGGAAQSAGSGSKTKNGKKRKLEKFSADANGLNKLSHNELRDKLQLRIAELKDERRRRQSERDKNKAKEIREARGTKGDKPARERTSRAAREQSSENGQSKRRKETGVPGNAVVEDDIDAGQLDFEPQSADVPFEATVNPRGTKGARLQKAIREEEARKRKIAAVAGDAEAEAEINNEVRMQRALARAKGEKVHDDVARLRKSQKLNEKKKKKTKEKWNARIDTVEKEIKEKQKTRKENIQKKVQSKKKNREAKRGFEGKVEGYLNKD